MHKFTLFLALFVPYAISLEVATDKKPVVREDVPVEDEGNNKPQIPQFLNRFPSPNGPFYGFPFDTKSTLGGMLPFTVSGQCESGVVYTIKKPEDVLQYQNDIECLYNAGQAPSKVPEGALYGTLISAVNTKLFNQFATQFWKGSSINKTECNGNTAYIGWNNVLGTPLNPFVAHIGHHHLNLAPGEYDNGRNALIAERDIDVTQICPEYRQKLLQTAGRAGLSASRLGNTYPLNQMVCAIRFIGKQEDGGDIYLGKIYLKDAYREDEQAVTVAYYVLVNFDKDANPLTISGLPLVPSTTGFKYMHPGLADLFFRVLPIDNFLTAPVRTLNKFVRGAVRAGTNSLLFAQALPFGLRNLRQNSRLYQNRFYNDIKAVRDMNKGTKPMPIQVQKVVTTENPPTNTFKVQPSKNQAQPRPQQQTVQIKQTPLPPKSNSNNNNNIRYQYRPRDDLPLDDDEAIIGQSIQQPEEQIIPVAVQVPLPKQNPNKP